jgi:DNA repair exonuclease SbcCD ATPase subunit
LDICGLIQEHYDKLQLTAEQVEKLRNELHVRFTLLSNDLKMQSKNRKALTVEHENNMENLKNARKNCPHLKYSFTTKFFMSILHVHIIMT